MKRMGKSGRNDERNSNPQKIFQFAGGHVLTQKCGPIAILDVPAILSLPFHLQHKCLSPLSILERGKGISTKWELFLTTRHLVLEDLDMEID